MMIPERRRGWAIGRAALATLAIAGALLAGQAPLAAAGPAQPPAAQPQAAQDDFVPIDQLPQDEQLPAAPLVMAAYSIAWLVVFGYLWSIWRRLGRVEREMAEVSRRVEGGTRR